MVAKPKPSCERSMARGGQCDHRKDQHQHKQIYDVVDLEAGDLDTLGRMI